MKIIHFKQTDVSKGYPPFKRRSCLIPKSTLLFENLGKSKNYQVILFLLSSNAKKEFYRIKQFSRENNNKVFSITLKGYCCELDILSPINEYNSEPVNIGEVCVQGILLQEEGVEACGEELSSDTVEVGQEAGQLISHYS